AGGSGNETLLPLAIRHAEPRRQDLAALLMSVAPDHGGPILLPDRDQGAAAIRPSVSALIVTRARPAGGFAACLESLRLQTMTDGIDVIAVLDPGRTQHESKLKELRRIFPRRH